MATTNFSYRNRCIVVNNDDLECGNVPDMEYVAQSNRCYPQYMIPSEFKFHNIVLNAGYYTGESLFGYGYGCCPVTKREFFADMKEMCGISGYRLDKLCRGIQRENFEYDYEFSNALCEAVGVWLAKREEAAVNLFLDNLKQKYGYTEYVCAVRFSNGESVYMPKAAV